MADKGGETEMGIFKKRSEDVGDLIARRGQLLKEIIPLLQEQVRVNPSAGGVHLEYAKALAMAGELERAKAESEAAMLKFPVSQRQPVRDVQAEIERLIENRRLGI
jgi:protein involved in temperature-dependent protein secretion